MKKAEMELFVRFVEAHEKIAEQLSDLVSVANYNAVNIAIDGTAKSISEVASAIENIKKEV